MAALIKYGIRGPFPLKDFPEGKVRVRVRNNAFPVAYVYQHGKSIRKFLVAEKDGYWIPFHEQQANHTFNQTTKESQLGNKGGE